MAIRPQKNGCGFTLFEFAVSVIILGVLAGTLLSRSALYQGEAERVAARQLVATLRAALQVRASEVRRQVGDSGLQMLLEENPFDWLIKKPENYLGEYYSPELEKMPTGNWLFDRRDKMLIYLVASQKSFSSDASNLLKFKVEFAHMPQQAGLTNGPAEVSKGVDLHQISDEAATKKD
jgi:general secretion pathway protein G